MRSTTEKECAKKCIEKTYAGLPEVNAFGENNYAERDAMLYVIEDEPLDDTIYDKYDPESDGEDPRLHAALDARRWLDGDDDAIEGYKDYANAKALD